MKAIAAMSNNRVIGSNGTLPWKNKKDMNFFKAMTVRHNILMGRKTWDSIPKGLPSRNIYVLSNGSPKVKKLPMWDSSLPQINKFINETDLIGTNLIEKIGWLCGGSTLYSQFLPYCSDLYLTIILDDYEGDVFMPEFEYHFTEQRIIKEFSDMWIVHYWRKGTIIEESYTDGFDAKLMNILINPYKFDSLVCGLNQTLRINWNVGWNEAPKLKI